MQHETLLTIHQLHRSYHKQARPLFAGFDLDIKQGEFVVIQGGSGSGKTTLMRLLTGSLTAGHGHIYWGRDDISRYTAQELQLYKRDLGLVFQHNNLIGSKTVEENICYPLALMGVDETSVKSTYDTLMESMNIAHLSQRSIDHLSGGERQKIAFARAIIKKPSLILADEPTGNLDWASTKAIADTMIQSHHDGNTNVVITHDLLFAKYITQSCDARLVSLPTLDQNLQPASHYTRSALVGSSLIHSHS